MNKIFLFSILLLAFSCKTEEEVKIPEPFVIAFGSCNNQNVENPMWESIEKHNPDLFIWLGDNVYGDSPIVDTLKEAYAIMNRRKEYQKFKATGVSIIGTWDDHDYGRNDAGKNWRIKEESKQLMLGFLEVDTGHAVWDHEGVYQSYTYGKENFSVKVILLDTRTFRDNLKLDTAKGKRYAPNMYGDILGGEQWKWFENELKINTSQVTIIGSSIQYLSEEHGWERWSALPTAQERFHRLMNKYKPESLIILSGDRHIAEVSKSSFNGMSLYDITSSGMTHVYYSDEEPNKYRVSPFITSRNWGLLTVNWEGDEPEITTEIRGEKDSLFYKDVLSFR